MESFKIGLFAESLSGHDAGSFYVIVGERAGRILVSDGRLRPLERPKAKNPAHLKVNKTAVTAETLAMIGRKSGGVNEAIKREISFYRKKEV